MPPLQFRPRCSPAFLLLLPSAAPLLPLTQRDCSLTQNVLFAKAVRGGPVTPCLLSRGRCPHLPYCRPFPPLGGLLCTCRGLVNLLQALVLWGSGSWACGSPSPGTLCYRNTQLQIILQTGHKQAGGGALEMRFCCYCCNNYHSSWKCDSQIFSQ